MSFGKWFNCWGLGPELSDEQKEKILKRARWHFQSWAKRLLRVEIGDQPFLVGHHCGMPMVKVTPYFTGGASCSVHPEDGIPDDPVYVCSCPHCSYLWVPKPREPRRD